MCTISRDAVRRACYKTMTHQSLNQIKRERRNGVDVTARCFGRTFNYHIPMEKINEAYGKAWDNVIGKK